MLEKPEEVIKWRNRVNSADDNKWTVDPMSVSDDVEEEESDARFYEKINTREGISDRVVRALAGFFTAYEWVPRERGQPKSKQVTVAMVRKELRDVVRWNGFKTSGNKGYQRFRTSKSSKEGEGRDMSWAFVSGSKGHVSTCY